MRRLLVLLALLLWAAPVQAAISVVQTATNRCSGCSTATATVSALTSGNLLIVTGGLSHNARTLVALTNGTNICSAVTPDIELEHSDATVDVRSYIWICPITTGGQTEVSVQINTGTDQLNVAALEVSGLDSTPLDQTASVSTLAATTHATTATTTVADEILIVNACASTTATFVVGSGFTLVSGGGGSVECGTEYRIVNSTSTWSLTIDTTGNRNVALVGATYKISGGGGGGPTTAPRLTLLGVGGR